MAFSFGLINGIQLGFCMRFGQRIVYNSGSVVDANLASVIKDKNWSWPSTRSEEFVQI